MSQRLERLINLVIALRQARVPMTAAEIREEVAGYGQSDHAAFRRMFERDKADLRSLGVPVQTASSELLGGREGYRIAPEDYDLEPIALDPDELTALTLALQATGLERHRGLRKLEVDAADTRGAQDAGADADAQGTPTVSVALDGPHRDALLAAQLQGLRVRFRYRRPGAQPQTRTLDPAGLVHRGGRWYVVGHDPDRGERRAFRLDRIAGDVELAGEAQAVPGPVTVDDVLPETDPVTAEVAATADAGWLVARRADGPGRPLPDGRIAYSVPARDTEELLGWLLRLGPEVEVLGPAPMRTRMVAALDRLLEAGR
jgi:predicted DNA-binding transcriptional regulator YafY